MARPRWRHRRAWIAAGILLLVVLAGFGVLRERVAIIALENLENARFERGHDTRPAELGLAAHNLTFASDGIPLAAWWIPAPPDAGNPSPIVVLVHGLGSNMSKPMRLWAPHLHGLGYHVFVFDLRNHGASGDGPGGLVTYGAAESRDVLAAVRTARAAAPTFGADPDRIALYGGSMGAASVLRAASTDPDGVVAVVADSAYASFSFQAHLDGAEDGYPRWLVDWVVGTMDDLAPEPPSSTRPTDHVAGLGVPLLLAHCEDDRRVSAANLDRLVAAAPPVTTVWLAPCPAGESDDQHLDGWANPGYNATVASFLHASFSV